MAGGYSPSRRSGVCSGGSASSISLVKIRSLRVVVGQLVVVAHRDRVERAGDLAVAAEDAARHVDLVDRGVALAGRDLVARACSRRRRRGCSRPGRRPRRASSRRTSRGPCPRSAAACGGRGSAGRPASSPPGTGSSRGPRPGGRRSCAGRAGSRRRRGRRRRGRRARGRAAPGVAALCQSGVVASRGHQHDRRHEHVQGRERQQDLPAEGHQLVVAQARQRGADPDEEEQDERTSSGASRAARAPPGRGRASRRGSRRRRCRR